MKLEEALAADFEGLRLAGIVAETRWGQEVPASMLLALLRMRLAGQAKATVRSFVDDYYRRTGWRHGFALAQRSGLLVRIPRGGRKLTAPPIPVEISRRGWRDMGDLCVFLQQELSR